MWDFETDPDYQEKLDWAADFMRTRVEPLQFVVNHPFQCENVAHLHNAGVHTVQYRHGGAVA